MTQIDFYLGAKGISRTQLTCRLAETAYKRGHRIFIWVPEEHLTDLDMLLWTFNPTSFLPHGRLSNSHEPIVLDSQEIAEGDVLIPLHERPPTQFQGFTRVLEPVGDNDAEKALSRIRFRFYRDQGTTPVVHTL